MGEVGGGLSPGSSRLIGLDYGARTVGVAVSDPLGLTATPVTVLRRENEDDVKETVRRIGEIAAEYGAFKLVLGLPLNLSGGESVQTAKTREFCRRLQKDLRGLEVVYYDERLTSKASEKVMKAGGLGRAKRAEIVDMLAAARILEDYLDRERNLKKERDKMKDMNEELNLEGDEQEVITMRDENGNETDFLVVDEVELDGNTYILVVDEETADEDESDAVIFKLAGTEGEDAVYEEIEDDDEFNRVAEEFGKRGEDEYDLDV